MLIFGTFRSRPLTNATTLTPQSKWPMLNFTGSPKTWPIPLLKSANQALFPVCAKITICSSASAEYCPSDHRLYLESMFIQDGTHLIKRIPCCANLDSSWIKSLRVRGGSGTAQNDLYPAVLAVPGGLWQFWIQIIALNGLHSHSEYILSVYFLTGKPASS